MDAAFAEPALAIYAGDLDELARLIATDPRIPVRKSSVGHPTLLQLVACEASELPDAVGAARLLVDGGATLGDPLVAAAGCASRAVLEYLLDEGAVIDGETTWSPLDEALYWANDEIAAMLVRRGARIRALSTAAGLGDLERIETFLESGVPTSVAGPIASPFADTIPEGAADDPAEILDHAFVMAANCGQLDAARVLLDHGARVNSVPPGFHWRGTALHAAIWRGSSEVVAWLMAVGADPAIRDGLVHADALGWARHHDRPELVELLD